MSYAARARRFLADRSAPSVVATYGCERSERSEERGDACDPALIWWADPARSPLPPTADDWDREMRDAYAPIVHLPPRGCLAPRVCSRGGPCDRSRAGCNAADEEHG